MLQPNLPLCDEHHMQPTTANSTGLALQINCRPHVCMPRCTCPGLLFGKQSHNRTCCSWNCSTSSRLVDIHAYSVQIKSRRQARYHRHSFHGSRLTRAVVERLHKMVLHKWPEQRMATQRSHTAAALCNIDWRMMSSRTPRIFARSPRGIQPDVVDTMAVRTNQDQDTQYCYKSRC